MASGVTRIGAVSYLNTRPLVYGLQDRALADRLILTYGSPSELAEGMENGRLDVALLPVIELGRMEGLELVPGIGIACRGPARSVSLVCKRPLPEIGTVALDPESRTTNGLVRVLFDSLWNHDPAYLTGGADLVDTLERADAAVRIGDKALFEPVPEGCEKIDLAEAWCDWTGLPFVFAVWACRPGQDLADLSAILGRSLVSGLACIDRIVTDYTWESAHHRETAADYLRNNIRYGIGGMELQGIGAFMRHAARLSLIEHVPDLSPACAGGTLPACSGLPAGDDR